MVGITMEKVRVLTATGTMNAGGAESLIMEILRQKSEKIEHIMLIHYDGEKKAGVYDEEIRKLGVPIYYIPSVGSIGIRSYVREFQRVLREIGTVDILHSHLNAVGGVIALAAKKAGIAHRIVHCHANITYRGSRISIALNEIRLLLMKRYVNRYATDFWACSEQAAQRLFYPRKEKVIIPNVICVANYLYDEQKRTEAKRKYGVEHTELVLGAVGRIARIKNYAFALSVLAALRKRGIDAEFLCFGRKTDDSYYQELKRKAQELMIAPYVHFLGNSTDIGFDISCFDAFIMPSDSEGFGMAAIEAQAASLPTFVSTGVPEAVDVGAGLISFLPTESAEVWADAIQNIKTDPLTDHDKIIRCFEEKGLNSETAVKKIEELYCKISKGKASDGDQATNTKE